MSFAHLVKREENPLSGSAFGFPQDSIRQHHGDPETVGFLLQEEQVGGSRLEAWGCSNLPFHSIQAATGDLNAKDLPGLVLS